MCGIYGRVALQGTTDEADGASRTERIRHRGPDFTGTWTDGRVFFGHNRLSIIDPNPAANQPFGDPDTRLIFNGEIYNYRRLRDAHLSGVVQRTSSDTEVLFELVRRLGHRCLRELNGMFAFAFHDGRRNELLLARDISGIKPLYYVHDDQHFEFASEIKSLTTTVRRDALKEVLTRGCFEEGVLPWTDVRELPPGHYLTLSLGDGRIDVRPFHSLRSTIDANRFAELDRATDLVDQLDRLLQESIELHLQSDAPVGSLCSGGLDSSLVSAMALQRSREVKLYHAGIDGPGGEEAYAQIVSEHIRMPIAYVKMTKEHYWDTFATVTWHNDLPVFHPNDISLHAIAGKAHSDGMKVLLTGEGADEMFGGYSWQRYFISTLARFRRFPRRGIFRKASRLLGGITAFDSGLHNFDAHDFAAYAPFGAGMSREGVERTYRGAALIAQDFCKWKQWMENLRAYDGVAPESDRSALGFILNNMYGHLGTILHRTDRILMAQSIEGRVPFLENGLFDFALNLPLRHKIRRGRGKVLLKKVAERYLPHKIVHRRKVGFPVPWSEYLPDRPRILQDGFVSDWTQLSASDLEAWYRTDPILKFRLIAIEVWGRVFLGGESPKSVRVL